MSATRKILTNKKYGVKDRIRKKGLPNACHSTRIFEHFKVSFDGYAKEVVKSPWVVQKESLKTMKLY